MATTVVAAILMARVISKKIKRVSELENLLQSEEKTMGAMQEALLELKQKNEKLSTKIV